MSNKNEMSCCHTESERKTVRKWLASVLLVCLASGSFFSEATVAPAQGAVKAMNSATSSVKTIQAPVHEQIVFNDYQVAGLSTEGWNWVKNDEFILPPQTPLDIDLIQTTYGNGKATNKNEVFLDGTALPELSSETADDVSTLRWEVPRFTIPAEQLSAGIHTLTFVVSDGLGEKSTVYVRFRVEALHYPLIYQGNNPVGPNIASGSTEAIYGNYGTKVYYANTSGVWKLTYPQNGNTIKGETGNLFSTGVLIAGGYELSFTPDDLNQTPWQVELQVGPPVLYLGTDENGQQLNDKQKVTAENAPGTVQLFSPAPGRWWVDGTGQTLINSQYFEAVVPEKLEGMTMSVTFEPDQPGTERSSNSMITIQIQVPGAPSGCDAGSARATLDVLKQNNVGSSLLTERENLYSSDITVKVYQDPIYKIWVTTSADHLRYDYDSSEEGPGVWAVDNVVVDNSYLNWDHTALEISRFKEGRHKINYYSKTKPDVTWCGYIQVIEDKPPTSSTPSCDVGEEGTIPPSTKMKLIGESGKEFVDGDKITVESSKDLEKLQLMAVHVENKGMKRVKREKNNKDDRRFLYVADLQWEYDMIPFGANYEYGYGPISSKNMVVIKYEGEVIKTIKPKSSEDDEPGGVDLLDLPSIIAYDGRSGEYKVEVHNTMTYGTCSIVRRDKSYKKYLKDVDKEQKLVLTVDVK